MVRSFQFLEQARDFSHLTFAYKPGIFSPFRTSADDDTNSTSSRVTATSYPAQSQWKGAPRVEPITHSNCRPRLSVRPR